MRAWSLAAYLALVIERFSQSLQGVTTALPAQIRRAEGLEGLKLELSYHPAQSARGYVLIPKDRYFNETEHILSGYRSR